LPIKAELKAQIIPFDEGLSIIARLAYVTFLGNAVRFLPFFEARQLPFIFQLYPGGGFEVGQADVDEQLRKVLQSPLCRKVVTTQRITRDYIVNNIGYDPAKVELIFGGVFESRIEFDFHRDKKRWGRDKETIDFCFVAHKYGDDLTSKGYDQFIAIAQALARDARLRFHVVGDYAADDIPLGAARARFQFYGARENEFFATFYPSMDAILSINRPFTLRPGAFDGFPTGACIEAGFRGVLNCINDPLGLNEALNPEQDFVLLDYHTDASVERLSSLLTDMDQFYALAYRNCRKYQQVFGTDGQLWPRTRLIAAELARPEFLVCPPSPSPSPLDAELTRNDPELLAQVEALDVERKRLGGEYAKLVASYQALEEHARELEASYRTLEKHYLAVDGERKRLEDYIRRSVAS
jgi:hypothetical protein